MSDISNDEVVQSRKRKNPFRIPISSDESDDSETDSEIDFSSASEFGDEISSDSFSEEDDRIETSEWDAEENIRAPFTFCGNPGQQFTVPQSAKRNCLFYFDKLFDIEILSIIVEQVNLYAEQHIRKTNMKQRSRARDWFPTNNTEIKCFMAILVLQGIIRKPTLQMYYSKRESICTPFFSKVMPRERFLLLCKFLHFENNTNMTSGSKLRKIEKLVKIIQQKFKTLYIPTQDICIDECLVLWKGRLSWKQYIPSKRSRFGIKFYVLCESQSGYIWNFCIYTGKDTDYGQNYPEYKTSSRIVLELCHDLFHQGYKLYLDNWYTSIQLADKLCEYRTDMIGTMRQNRIGIPLDIKTTTLKKGQWIARYKNKMMIFKWRDKRDVLLISTIHGTNMIQKEKRGTIITKPEVVQDYATKMGGVDLSDGMIASYTLARKRIKKYYKKIFLHLVDVMCMNAFLLYKKKWWETHSVKFLARMC